MSHVQITGSKALRTSLVAFAAAAALVGCGSSKSSSSTPASSGSSTSAAASSNSVTSTNSTNSSGAISTAARAQAEKIIAPYTGHPNAFPVDAPLTRRPVGARIAMVDDGTPLVALLYELLQPAAKEMGVTLYRVKAGTTASGVNAAFETVAQQKPAAVINTAIDPNLWKGALQELQSEHVPIVSLGTVANPSFKLVEPNGGPSFANEGRAQAAWIVANAKGTPNVAYYTEPELAFSPVKEQAFVSEMHQLCPSCPVRTMNIPIATVNNTAPSAIISDLQSHPGTTVVAFGSSEIMGGLPAALKAAGLNVQTVGANGAPATLAYLKQGQETVEMAADLPVLAWTAMDAAGRLITHQALSPAEANETALVNQFLSPQDVTPSVLKQGWTGYPDFAARFAKLWGVSR
jgi:ribose transport system substrate-binding protein